MHNNVGLILSASIFRSFVSSHENDHKTEMNFDGVQSHLSKLLTALHMHVDGRGEESYGLE